MPGPVPPGGAGSGHSQRRGRQLRRRRLCAASRLRPPSRLPGARRPGRRAIWNVGPVRRAHFGAGPAAAGLGLTEKPAGDPRRAGEPPSRAGPDRAATQPQAGRPPPGLSRPRRRASVQVTRRPHILNRGRGRNRRGGAGLGLGRLEEVATRAGPGRDRPGVPRQPNGPPAARPVRAGRLDGRAVGLGAAAVAEKFASLLPDLMRYRDISPGPQNFELQTATGYEALLHLHKCAELVLVDIRALPHRDRRRFGPWHSGHGLRRGPAAAAVAAAAAQPGLCSRCHKLAMVPEQEAGVG